MCSDDQIWLLEAVSRYITLTNDQEFLNQEFKMADSNKKRKLIDTLKAIIIYSSQISVGKHGLPLLDCADWNDCLRIDDDYLNGPKKERKYHYQLIKNKERSILTFIPILVGLVIILWTAGELLFPH